MTLDLLMARNGEEDREDMALGGRRRGQGILPPLQVGKAHLRNRVAGKVGEGPGQIGVQTAGQHDWERSTSRRRRRLGEERCIGQRRRLGRGERRKRIFKLPPGRGDL